MFAKHHLPEIIFNFRRVAYVYVYILGYFDASIFYIVIVIAIVIAFTNLCSPLIRPQIGAYRITGLDCSDCLT